MDKNYLYIAYLPPNGNWLPRVMTRLRESSSATLRTRMNSWGETPLSEMGLAFSTKLAMLSRIVDRVDTQLRRLGGHLKKNEAKIWECVQTRAAYIVPDNLLPYEILVDIDSFLFESRSIYEIVGRFISEFHDRILGQTITEVEIKSMLDGRGIDNRWIQELRENRILFFHKTAPWMAVEVTSVNPPKFELLILKRDVTDFTDPDEYVHFNQLREVYNGFRSAMGAIYQWLLDKIAEFEGMEST